jgi:O-antigen/teichoic acid export membrane protein
MALMISSGGTAILGIVFWGLATHISSAEVIGKTSAEIAAMVLIANLAQLSFGPIFERFLPVAGDQTRNFIKRAYTLCTVVALAMVLIYVTAGIGHSFLPSSFVWRALFVIAVVMWTIFVLQDSALIGLRASRWVPVENILFALAKLSLLPVLVMVSKTQGIFLAWTTPVAIAIAVISWYLFTRRIPQHMAASSSSERLPSTRELILLTGAQYTSLIISVITSSIVTLYVISRLGAVANAHFYVPAQIAAGPLLMLWAITRSFLVEAANEPHALRRHSNTTIIAMLVVLVPSMAVGVIFAPDFLRIFGATYAEHGTTLLRMMLLALPGTAITDFYSCYAWLDRHVWWMTLRQTIAAVIYFTVLVTCIGHFGILAVGIASLVSSGIQGICFLPISIRRYRQTSDAEVAS